MKIIKRIIITLLVIILLLTIGIIVLAVIAFDGSTLGFDPYGSHLKLEHVVGTEMVDSLNSIYESNYEEDKNKIEIGITADTLNDFVFEMIRTMDGNEKYYDGSSDEKKYILEENNIRFNTVEFIMNEDLTLAAKIRLNALSFYQTSLYLSANISVKTGTELVDSGASCVNFKDDKHILDIEFSELKLGNTLGVSASWIKSVLKNFNLNIDSGVNFDVNRMALYLNFDEVLKNGCSDEFLLSLLQSCDYQVNIKKRDTDTEPKIYLDVDTNNIFSSDAINEITANKLDVFAKIVTDSLENNPTTLSEDEFNALINDGLNSRIAEFNKNINLGDELVTLSISNPYFDLGNEELVGNFKFNQTNSVALISIDFNFDKYNRLVIININNVYAGKIKASAFTDGDGTIMQSIEIPLSELLGTYGNKIKNITIDNTTEEVTITYQ